jgi:hypothetical protein
MFLSFVVLQREQSEAHYARNNSESIYRGSHIVDVYIETFAIVQSLPKPHPYAFSCSGFSAREQPTWTTTLLGSYFLLIIDSVSTAPWTWPRGQRGLRVSVILSSRSATAAPGRWNVFISITICTLIHSARDLNVPIYTETTPVRNSTGRLTISDVSFRNVNFLCSLPYPFQVLHAISHEWLAEVVNRKASHFYTSHIHIKMISVFTE